MGRYLLRLLCSVTYLVLLAGMISGMSEIWFGWSLLLVVTASVLTFVVGLALAVRWATRHSEGEAIRPQLSIAALLFLTGLAALYCALVRLVMFQAVQPTAGVWIGALIYSAVLLLLGIPFVLLLGDVLLAGAAWLVHRVWFQRLVRRLSGR
ncbi:MAG: hypothetical protein J5I93_28100 [Pirellulaceae bacterium]|nr:hypothetical protein [Pirellulaceae bacterium]